MFFKQQTITLQPRSRGFHLITKEVTQALTTLSSIEAGLLHLFLQHTSASLTLNENTDPDVMIDLEYFFNKAVPEDDPRYRHTCEGPDDLPAHIKCSSLGVFLTLPISNGTLALGCWQGIILGEHREHAPARRLLATIMANHP